MLNPDVIEIARTRDAERRSGKPLGKLHGIPVMLKDIFLTTDAMPSTGTVSESLVILLILKGFSWLQWPYRCQT